eukprot:gnl/TRDRNA2_/TRDRNA2_162161_c0_seq2.p1 gnl/TRDRNA2_/TRDRNA2_162161_c0~~gnl/TRDRNA2_/TRDRNA2_162161_c0_seq2.p1  ORF type:complete len:306 (-),score=14.52 gnl/TRDRNA2_/TRDRNA2_162161_c0_seq2:115-1032(-)
MQAVPPLLRLTRLLNMPTDVPQRMKLAQHISVETEKRRQQLLAQGAVCKREGFSDPVDMLNIELFDIHFSQGEGDRNLTIRHGMSIEQGCLICLVGGRGSGKGSILQILGNVILPKLRDSADLEKVKNLFVPSHLRVLYVADVDMFIAGTVFANLTMGTREGDPDGELDRVHKICEDIGMSERLLHFISSNVNLEWNAVLSHTERRLISLARALIANPEMLIIHKPTAGFAEGQAHLILGLLRAFVDKRGVEQDESRWYMRRPRTCIMSGMRTASVELSDQIYRVSRTDGIQLLESSAVTPDMLG